MEMGFELGRRLRIYNAETFGAINARTLRDLALCICNYCIFFGFGSWVYSNSNSAKNSLDLQKLLDYFGLKFKLNV